MFLSVNGTAQSYGVIPEHPAERSGTSVVEKGGAHADRYEMATPPDSMQRVGRAGRTGVVGTVVAAFAFFDGVFLGAPIALLAASFRPLIVYAVATVVVILLVIACCSWVDRRWDDWFSGNSKRIEARLEGCGRAA